MKQKIYKFNNKTDEVFENFLGKYFRYIVTILLLILIFFPLYWLASNSLRTEAEYLANPPKLISRTITFHNYYKILFENTVLYGLYNSVFVTFFSTIFTVLFGNLAAYSLVRGRLGKIRHFFAFCFLVQKMYPAIAMAIPIYISMRKFNLIDTKLSLVIMNTSFSLPLVIWLMMGFFQEIPIAIEESGIIDGANMRQRFFLLNFPVAKTGIIASAILTFVNVWNEFLFAVILTVKHAKTLPVIISAYITDRGLDWGPMSATGMIIILPVLVLVWCLQKDFVKGLIMGSVKG